MESTRREVRPVDGRHGGGRPPQPGMIRSSPAFVVLREIQAWSADVSDWMPTEAEVDLIRTAIELLRAVAARAASESSRDRPLLRAAGASTSPA